MDRKALQDYSQWLGKTPVEILGHVIALGGWIEVFPPGTKIERWLSRVRNFFNVLPKSLTRVDNILAMRVIADGKLRPSRGTAAAAAKDVVLALAAPSGEVYREPNGRYLMEMSQAGSQYHSKEA